MSRDFIFGTSNSDTQLTHNSESAHRNHGDAYIYYRNVLAYASGVSVVLGAITLSTLSCTKFVTENMNFFFIYPQHN